MLARGGFLPLPTSALATALIVPSPPPAMMRFAPSASASLTTRGLSFLFQGIRTRRSMPLPRTYLTASLTSGSFADFRCRTRQIWDPMTLLDSGRFSCGTNRSIRNQPREEAALWLIRRHRTGRLRHRLL